MAAAPLDTAVLSQALSGVEATLVDAIRQQVRLEASALNTAPLQAAIDSNGAALLGQLEEVKGALTQLSGHVTQQTQQLQASTQAQTNAIVAAMVVQAQVTARAANAVAVTQHSRCWYAWQVIRGSCLLMQSGPEA